MNTNDAKERKIFEKQFYPFYNFLHGKNQQKQSLREKQALFYNENKIQIFKGDDFIKFLLDHNEKIANIYPQLNKKQITLLDDKDVLSLGKQLVDSKIIMRLERHQDDPGKRFPKRLQLTKDQKFTADSFFTWNIVVRSSFSNVKMFLILLSVFLAFLYPIWPFEFKYAVFKLTLYLSIFLLSFLFARIFVYLFFRLFGYSIWILPNFDNDQLGFFETFKPLLSIDKEKDGKLEILFRFIGIISLGLIIYAVSQEPTIIQDIETGSEQIVDDILDWGKTKLEGKVEPLHQRAIPDLSEILRQDESSFNSLETDIDINNDNNTKNDNGDNTTKNDEIENHTLTNNDDVFDDVDDDDDDEIKKEL